MMKAKKWISLFTAIALVMIMTGSVFAEGGQKININTADKETLMTLPGIGPVKADEIIKIRKEGKFKNLDDVMNVTGIGEETLKKIEPFLKF